VQGERQGVEDVPRLHQEGGHGDGRQGRGGCDKADEQELERTAVDQRRGQNGPPPVEARLHHKGAEGLEENGVVSGYRAVIDPVALGRGLEVLIDVEIYAQDRGTVEEFENTVVSYGEVVEFWRMYGRPDYFLRVAVADHAAYEAFLMTRLSGLPAVLRLESHLTMKTIKENG
jgi:DNA-binding Lrp family transcriptional regulator